MEISDTEGLLMSEVMKRVMKVSQMGKKDIAKEIRARALMRSILAEAGRTDERFLGPEWIQIANDILSKSSKDQTAESIADKLRKAILSGGSE